MYDIAYILSNDIKDDELIYSVRTVVKNFPYDKIWFVGGTPKHIKPDIQLAMKQTGNNKWEKVRNSIKMLCNEPTLSDDFWLFNDDFFIMQKINNLTPMINGTLERQIRKLNNKYKQNSTYMTQLIKTKKALEIRDMDTLNYAIHIPILINKQKMLQTITEFPDVPMVRTLYGNQHRIKGQIMDDVKITKLEQSPTGEEIFLSTSEISFEKGKVGEHIKERFPQESKYERRKSTWATIRK